MRLIAKHRLVINALSGLEIDPEHKIFLLCQLTAQLTNLPNKAITNVFYVHSQTCISMI